MPKKTEIDHYSDKEALDFHIKGKSGKIEISSSKPLTTKRDLSLAYSPGVAAPVKEISKNPELAYDYTSKGNLVAVISNGSAILGLGNLGSLASKPVMEGKSVLFKRFADIDSIDIEINNNDGGRSSFLECDYEETIGVDSKKGLSKAEKIYQNRLRDSFMESGTTILDPETVFFSHDTKIGKDVEIEANIVFGENVTIKDNVVIKSFCSIENSIINNGSSIGPFARLRNNVNVGKDTKIGNFVEIKNSSLENDVKISHLSYIGDAEIQDSANIGAGTITCNYDGVNKHKTTIGKRSFIGSNTSLIAPINIGNDASIAAGSSISKDVDSNSLAITRAPIRFITNWSKKFKKR